MSSQIFRISLYLPAQAAAESEATILSWKVSPGDRFARGRLLAEAESAKASFDFEAPCDGTVVKILVEQGGTTPFEKPVLEVDTADASMREAIPHAAAGGITTQMAVVAPKTESAPADDGVYVMGVGGYLPERVIRTTDMLADFPDVTAEYMIGVTGIAERHWAADTEKPSDMAYRASAEAIEKSRIKPSDLGAIVLATTTPDVIMPSTACILQDKLGIRGIPSFDLNAACSGWLYALTVARGLIAAAVADNVLVVGVDLQSRMLDVKDKGTFFLFGDGAGATVLSKNGPGHRMREQILAADPKGLNMARRSAPGDRIDPGPDPWVRLDGHALFRFAAESFSALIREVIEKSGWGPDDVRWVVPHQANGRILKAAASRSGVAFERFYLNIARVGNTSSASIPLALIEIENGIQKGDKIVMCSVGAGITAAAVTVEW